MAGSIAASTCACSSAHTTSSRNGGDQPNVVPRNASIWFYFREDDYANIKDAVRHREQDGGRRGDDDRTRSSTSRILGAAYPQHMNKPIAEAMHENIKTVGMPKWSEEDQTLAKGAAEGAGQSAAGGLSPEARRLGAANPRT